MDRKNQNKTKNSQNSHETGYQNKQEQHPQDKK